MSAEITGDAFAAPTAVGPIAGSAHGDRAEGTTPVLLMHGGPALTDYMSMLAGELEGRPWITYQQRGHAPSSLTGPFTVEQHVADALAVLDTLGIDRAIVLGHSWGGHLAMHFALAHPGRVAGLVIVDPLGAIGDGGAPALGAELRERLLPDAVEPYAEVSARLNGPEPTDDDFLASIALAWPGYFAEPATAPPLPSYMRASIAAYMSTFASVSEQLADGFADKLGAVTAPAIFVLGERSPMPVSQGEATAALFENAEVVVVPGAGHLPWHESPGCVAAALGKLADG
jgi:pimeloyl-ACP methyl ester carboxylesterase